MNLTPRSTLAEVASAVSRALSAAGIRAVLTGGACASLYSAGLYQSSDLDFVLEGSVSRGQLDRAMGAAGFRRRGAEYVHPRAPFWVEFLPGPLAIGQDLSITPVAYRVHRTSVLALSPTDSCRDRLAAFYHWNDRQSLQAALAIARSRRVSLKPIRAWSMKEGALPQFEEFVAELKRARPGRKARPR